MQHLRFGGRDEGVQMLCFIMSMKMIDEYYKLINCAK